MALPYVIKIRSLTEILNNGNPFVSAQPVGHGTRYETSHSFDNTDGRYTRLHIWASWSYTAAPIANRTVEVYLLRSFDGVNFESLTGDDPVWPIASFSPPATTASRKLLLVSGVDLQAAKYKIGIRNVDTGQTITITIRLYVDDYTIEE